MPKTSDTLKTVTTADSIKKILQSNQIKISNISSPIKSNNNLNSTRIKNPNALKTNARNYFSLNNAQSQTNESSRNISNYTTSYDNHAQNALAENTFDPVPHIKAKSTASSYNPQKRSTTFANQQASAGTQYILGNEGNANNLSANSYGYGHDLDAGGANYKQLFQRYRNGFETGFDPAEKGRTIIFITKPKLNIKSGPTLPKDDSQLTSKKLKEIEYNSVYNGYFQWINTYYKDLAKSLNYEIDSNQKEVPAFIPLLSNCFKSTNIDDFTTYEMVYGDTYRGYQERVSNTYAQSMSGGSLNVNYLEDADLSVMKLHKLWFEYIELVRFGYLTPSQSTLDRKELDYTSSLYYFSLEPDGETINFWGRYMGIFPQSIPYSAFGAGVGETGLVDLNCTYLYTFKQFMEPEILVDFNNIILAMDGDQSSKEKVFFKNGRNISVANNYNANVDAIEVAKYFSGTDYYGNITSNIINSNINYYNRALIYRKNNKFKLAYYRKEDNNTNQQKKTTTVK